MYPVRTKVKMGGFTGLTKVYVGGLSVCTKVYVGGFPVYTKVYDGFLLVLRCMWVCSPY